MPPLASVKCWRVRESSSPLASATVSPLVLRWKPASPVFTRGKRLYGDVTNLLMLCAHSGAATTASRLGMPDLAIATLNDFVEVCYPVLLEFAIGSIIGIQAGTMVASLDPVTPVIADADTGFGGPAMVGRTIFQYHRAGIAACHIEDQVQTKRCGHLLGKQVVSREEFVTRIRAAVIARDQIPGGSDFVIIGRTDSAQVLGMEEALYRLKLASAAGADVCFIEGVRTEELLRKTVAELAPRPVLVNVISGGLTPSFTTWEAERMGAKIISELKACVRLKASLTMIALASLLPCVLRRRIPWHSRRDGVAQEDWHRLQVRPRHGPEGLLRCHGPRPGCGARR
jgi:2-methylisocitrate lyase-like PEP mutase family enzyme